MPGFGGLPPEFSGYEGARVAVLPIPFDVSSSWMKGSDKGPAALIEASAHMELYDIETATEVYRRGIYTCEPILAPGAREMMDKARRRVAELLGDGKFVVALGGEHTISLGVMEAFAARYPAMGVLHLDAHADTRDEYEGDRYSHACVMARAREFVKDVVSVGIRSMDASEAGGLDLSRVFFAHELQAGDGWVEEALGKLPGEVYVTIDLDVFDPGIMPSTGTPEPGGLGWYQVMGLLRAVARQKTIVGFDVVELCPTENKAPDFLAAKLVYTLLSYRFSRQA
ncbi:MAG: agmatinase [Thermodesulfovibrionales bacterium]